MNDQQILNQAIEGLREGLDAACEREKRGGHRGDYAIPGGVELLACGFVVPSYNFLVVPIAPNANLATVFLGPRHENDTAPIQMKDKTIHTSAMSQAWLVADKLSNACEKIWIEFQTPSVFHILMNRTGQ